MAVYTIAFIFYTLDLAKRSASVQAATNVASVASPYVNGGTAVLERTEISEETGKRSRELNIAFALTIVAWVAHLSATLLRGFAAGRVPWANMFEFTLTATAIIVGVFLFVQLWQDLRFLGAYVVGFALIA